jgi:hypothetical protein
MRFDERMEGIDPVLAAAYAELRNESEHEPDWERLRRRIGDGAKPYLSRRRANRFLRMARPIVPLAAAASIAFGLWIGPSVMERMMVAPSQEFSASLTSDDGIVRVLDNELSDQEALRLVTGRDNPDAWLAFAINER